ncbi:AraC family transcriptional regulator [Robinsoniella sp. KNHs210]|uniref:AraC family transcriptional regulator n=1 Tax=Robinsoniella sp. KNHs210 TaxID=1469950 RepID=UPI00047FC7DD|nr:AraC family transcriptional regulator [Robinsoniella sp. KNHs210]
MRQSHYEVAHTSLYTYENSCFHDRTLTDSTEQTNELMVTNRHLAEMNPISAGYEKCVPNHFYGPQIRNYYIIHYVQSGKGYFIRNGEYYSLTQGSLFLIRPSELCKYYADNHDPWCYVWLGFTGTRADEFLSCTVFQNNRCVAHAPHIEYLFSEIRHVRLQNISLEFFLLSKIYELHTLLYDKKSENEYVEQAINYICNNYAEDITIDKLSRLLNIDRRHLGRLFLAQTGITPKAYLTNIRLQSAVELLKNTTYPVSEITKMSGYDNYCSFLKIFKKRYGVTPSEFR